MHVSTDVSNPALPHTATANANTSHTSQQHIIVCIRSFTSLLNVSFHIKVSNISLPHTASTKVNTSHTSPQNIIVSFRRSTSTLNVLVCNKAPREPWNSLPDYGHTGSGAADRDIVLFLIKQCGYFLPQPL